MNRVGATHGPRGVRSAAVLVALAALAGCGAGDDARGRVDGVVLFVCDTLRADRLSCYGYERPTPGIDRLARMGTLFENHHSQGHWTLPSMTSMMTGLYVQHESQALPLDRPTLAETLSEHGVETAAFVGNKVIGRERGFSRGFESFFVVENPMTRASELVRRFDAWRDEREKRDERRPWFCWIHTMDTHGPYTPLPEDAIYEGTRRPGLEDLRKLWAGATKDVEARNAGVQDWLPHLQAMQRMNAFSNAYDGEVRSVDRAVSSVLDRLERDGDLEHTAILFAADHGEMLFEYEHYPARLDDLARREGGLVKGLADWFVDGHEDWFYPQNWNTPMIAVGPGYASGRRVDALSANIDIYPTVLEFLGVARPSVLDGDLLSNADSRESVFAHGRTTTAVLRRDGMQAVEVGRGRYLEDATKTLVFDARAPRLVDLGDERPELRDELTSTIAAWKSDRAFVPNMDVPEITSSVLRQLGYAELPDELDESHAEGEVGDGDGDEE
ncbi:MAG: sulfatase [Planctomycetota bacterium]